MTFPHPQASLVLQPTCVPPPKPPTFSGLHVTGLWLVNTLFNFLSLSIFWSSFGCASRVPVKNQSFHFSFARVYRNRLPESKQRDFLPIPPPLKFTVFPLATMRALSLLFFWFPSGSAEGFVSFLSSGGSAKKLEVGIFLGF